MSNVDVRTVTSFGEEWNVFDQTRLSQGELQHLFSQYFGVFPWHALPSEPQGFDLGCGSGRWASCVAPRVGTLHCIDASEGALRVARKGLAAHRNCVFHRAAVDDIPLPDESMDFGYCLGVLHHVPDPLAGMRQAVAKLRPGAPLLLYLYYALDGRPRWFRGLWRISDLVRRVVSRLPFRAKLWVTSAIALVAYLPMARLARLLERAGARVDQLPLALYRNLSFYTMRTDALDRFGTPLERRFSAEEIAGMMRRAGLERVEFSPQPPFWCAVGHRAR